MGKQQRRYLVDVTSPESRPGESYRAQKTTTVTVWATSEYDATQQAQQEVGEWRGTVEVTPL